MTIADPKVTPQEVYALIRVTEMQQSSRSFTIYPDPHRLFYDRKMAMSSYSTNMIIV